MKKQLNFNTSYKAWLADLKSRIGRSQIKAAVRVNSTMLELYWSIGADIVARQAESVWGDRVLTQLSCDLRSVFPHMQGFSVTNLKYMKRFFLFYSNEDAAIRLNPSSADGSVSSIGHQAGDLLPSPEIGHQPGDQFPFPSALGAVSWRHHVEIMTHCKTIKEALFYVHETTEHGWSRGMLLNFMDTDLYARQGRAQTNFAAFLPKTQSDLANELLKDPYNFDFLTLSSDYRERELEDALTENITKFLLELGQCFAFVGRQVPVTVGDSELFIDLLFYHLELRCYVVIELKARKFDPAFVGQLGVYVAAINHQRKRPTDNPTLGLIICKTKDKIMAQYALESSSQPIGISEYQLSKLLPEDYKSARPTIEEIEAGLSARGVNDDRAGA
jgi:predicted nuclease of restriction endonuclease-like (RecB) superfamily